MHQNDTAIPRVTMGKNHESICASFDYKKKKTVQSWMMQKKEMDARFLIKLPSAAHSLGLQLELSLCI